MRCLDFASCFRFSALGLTALLWLGGCDTARDSVAGGPQGTGSTAGASGGGAAGGQGASDPCSNGRQDGTEEGIDCGGACPSCTVTYRIDPPDPCYDQFWVSGCQEGTASSTCGGKCRVANACSPPESSDKANLPMTFACPRFMLFSAEMVQAAKDDTRANGWGDANDPPFNYAVAGHDVDAGALDGNATSSCCHCYQLIFERPEPGSPQPPALPIPKPLIVQSFNTAAGGPKNFDLFLAAGGYGAFNACVDDPNFGNTSQFGHFMYDAFPTAFPGNGGVKFYNYDECKTNGAGTVDSVSSSACQGRIQQECEQALSPASASVTSSTRASCIESNQLDSLYHQNWTVRAKRVECPEGLTRVTGCRLQAAGLPLPNPSVRTAAQTDGSWGSNYTTTTMQDCCKPSCAWYDYVAGNSGRAASAPDGAWRSFYSCDAVGVPFTAP